MSFDIRQLRYAVVAADHGSFYRAARTLEVERSTLSRAILKLERSIGMPIFERSSGGVTMTLAGSSFFRARDDLAVAWVATVREATEGSSVCHNRARWQIARSRLVRGPTNKCS